MKFKVGDRVIIASEVSYSHKWTAKGRKATVVTIGNGLSMSVGIIFDDDTSEIEDFTRPWGVYAADVLDLKLWTGLDDILRMVPS